MYIHNILNDVIFIKLIISNTVQLYEIKRVLLLQIVHIYNTNFCKIFDERDVHPNIFNGIFESKILNLIHTNVSRNSPGRKVAADGNRRMFAEERTPKKQRNERA